MCPDDFDDAVRRDESEHTTDREENEHPDEPEGTEHPDEPEGTRHPDEPEGTRHPVEPEGTEHPDGESDLDGWESSKSGGGTGASGRDERSRIRAEPRIGVLEGFREFLNLLRSLDEADERRGIGHIRGDRSRIDYDVSIGTGFGIEDFRDRPDRRLGRPRGDRPPRRSRRGRPSVDQSGYHVTTREEGDGVVVIADLPGVGADELTVGFERHGETLVVAVEDEPVGQVTLPWPAKAEWSSFNNGVLEVHLREDE